MDNFFTVATIFTVLYTSTSEYSTGATLRPIDSIAAETKNVTAQYCPFPCTAGNQTLCYPPPCPPPFCVDPAKLQPTDCCEYCPNGPDCRGPDGSIVKYNRWKIIDGQNCTCKNIGQGTTCV